MADARSLLRASRAARKITHPHASYTSDGKLLCNLCDTPVKSDAHWQSHLHSTGHNLRLQRQKDVAATRGAQDDGAGAGKKRKADSLDSPAPPPQEKKKVKADSSPASDDAGDVAASVDEENPATAPEAAQPTQTNGQTNPNPTQPTPSEMNASDILAFEQSLADLEAEAALEDQQSRRNAATISAAPMTAEQLAAQAREEQSGQRGRRERELEDEREDQARVVEEEMEEMEGLEARVRRLRERRERLRGSDAGEKGMERGGGAVDRAVGRDGVKGDVEATAESSSDDDEDDPDEWKFGAS